MTDPGREQEGGQVKPSDGPQKRAAQEHDAKTAGTDRDADESGESRNQGHGHPREERQDG
jgi:hypothetical protein